MKQSKKLTRTQRNTLTRQFKYKGDLEKTRFYREDKEKFVIIDDVGKVITYNKVTGETYGTN